MSGVVTASLLPERVRRRHDEDDLQRAVVKFLRWSLPDNATFFHIPNGGQRHKRAAARLVGLGVRAGMPDLAIIADGRPLFIELKADAGRVSPAQMQMAMKLIYCGAEVLVCRSVEDVEHALSEAGVCLRGRVAA